MLTIQQKIEWDKIQNAFVGVMEGEYSPWAGRCKQLEGDTPNPKEKVVWYGHDEIWNDRLVIEFRYDDPDDDEGTFKGVKKIGAKDIQKGLQLMATGHTRHFNDLMQENDDAMTHDVLWQLIVLGEVIYG